MNSSRGVDKIKPHFLLVVLLISTMIAYNTGNVFAIKESYQNEVKTSSQSTFTLKEIIDAPARVKKFTETHHKLPEHVQISSKAVSMPDFLRLMVISTLEINSKKGSSVKLKSMKSPPKPSEDVSDGNINKAEYLDMAQRIGTFMDSNGIAPNYASSSRGYIRYENLIYTYSKILNYYKTNKRLPNYVSVSSWNKETPSSMKKYLQPTLNCQSKNNAIISQSSSISEGTNSNINKARKIFNWVRDHINYTFYFNTKYGALGTLNKRIGNCCDHSHLFVALSRAAGLPARYVHGNCVFKSGSKYGHVWAQIYVDGKWYNADTISSGNSLGVINNWDVKTADIDGYCRELTF